MKPENMEFYLHHTTSEEYCLKMFEKIMEKAAEVFDDGGHYLGDCVTVKVSIEYTPEDK